MAVPKFFEFFSAVVECLLSGEIVAASDMRHAIAQKMHLSEEDLSLVLPSGKQTEFRNRVNWAVTYLKKAGLIAAPARAQYQITAQGKKAYQETSGQITLPYLKTIPTFLEFHSAKGGEGKSGVEPPVPDDENTPQDILDFAYAKIKASLVDDLLSEIMRKPPIFFEKLVVDLLVKMGYGGTLEAPGMVTKQSGDEGIDGIIREDKLGFNSIYIQAKRWDLTATVGRPEIHRFFGALAGQGAKKGLFVTTAKFSKDAVNFARHQQIVLMDGKMLAELMIDYHVGVSLQSVYEIKRIDSDYFNEEE